MADRGPKRRRRGGLEPTAHELRYAGHSQLRQCYLDGSKSLYQGDIAGAFRRHRRASAAVRASRRPVPLPAALERLSRGHLGHLGRHLATARRDGIRYLYEVRGAFAACTTKRPDGSFVGLKADPMATRAQKLLDRMAQEKRFYRDGKDERRRTAF